LSGFIQVQKNKSLAVWCMIVQKMKFAYTLYFVQGMFAPNKKYGSETITEGGQDGEKGEG
jgi:hypothetical protein